MAQAEVRVSEISKQYEISTLYTVNLKNNMNIYKILGIDLGESIYKGNAFRGFENKSKLNEYLLKHKVITRKEFFMRENPELVSGNIISEEVASTPF